MITALFPTGLVADVEHWILPHLASLADLETNTQNEIFLNLKLDILLLPVGAAPVFPKQIFATVPIHVPSFVNFCETLVWS